MKHVIILRTGKRKQEDEDFCKSPCLTHGEFVANLADMRYFITFPI